MSGSASFREVLLRAIDDALLVPGEIVRVAIYDRIEKNCKIRREEIPEKLELFHKAVEQLMGHGEVDSKEPLPSAKPELQRP